MKGVSISPNPTADKLNVQLPAAGNYGVVVLDPTGRQVLTDRISANSSIDLSSFSAGIYVLEVRDLATNAVSRQRIVKR